MNRLSIHLGRVGLAFAALALLLVALMAGAAIGETAIPFDVVAKTIANRVFHAAYPLEPLDEGIVWSCRLSRAVVTACCGASLALAGAVLQSLLRNPLAHPYILGISAVASTGAVAVALLGFGAGFLTMPAGALISGLESDGADRFLCGGGQSGKVRAVRRPGRGQGASERAR